jgi:hypothetical protein
MEVNVISPSPLNFDRVMEGRAVAARNSPLFKIPVEVLAIIVSNLVTSDDDLASFALVNSDCRQLARSCQFRTVKLDFSPRSESVLAILQQEAVESRQNRGNTPSLSLSACIRRVVTDNAGYWKGINDLRPRKLDRSVDSDSDDDVTTTRRTRASNGARPLAKLAADSMKSFDLMCFSLSLAWYT